MSLSRWYAILAVVFLSSCSGSAVTSGPPSAAPSLNPFPAADVQYQKASSQLQQIWDPYQVKTIPARTDGDYTAHVPAVVNATGGVVNDATTQKWAQAFFKTMAWEQWAAAHAQTDFIPHIDPSFDVNTGFNTGATETLPDCMIFPTAMTLVVDPGQNQPGRSQFAFINTYGGPCAAVYNNPDGSKTKGNTIDPGTVTVIEHLGWVHSDPLLGEIWIDVGNQGCDGGNSCPAIPNPIPAEVPPAPLPAQATVITSASPQLQAQWSAYGLQIIPPASIFTQVPALPQITNDTDGVVDNKTATMWVNALMTDATWVSYSWAELQTNFQPHLSDGSFFGAFPTLGNAAGNGGKPAMKSCAFYPSSVTLARVNADDRNNIGNIVDQYKFDIKYSRPCTLTVTFPNGSTSTADLPPEVVTYGSVREDPLLGTIWYTDKVNVPASS